MFGSFPLFVSLVKLGRLTEYLLHSVRSLDTYAHGLWRTTYFPLFDNAQFEGIPSAYSLADLPAAIAFPNTEEPENALADGALSSVIPRVLPLAMAT